MMIDKSFENKVLSCLFRHREFAVVASQYLNSDYFDDIVSKNLGKMAIDFVKRYDQVITSDVFVYQIKELIDKKIIKEMEVDVYVKKYKELQKIDITDWEFVLDKLIDFIKKSEIKRFVERTVTQYLPKDDFASIEKEMGKILDINIFKNTDPYDYWDNIDNRTETRIEEEKLKEESAGRGILGISTGIKKLDETMFKQGWVGKELYIVLGAAKVGKSMSLLWFANIASLQGYNVVYFTLEVSHAILAARLDAMNSDVEINMLNQKIRDVQERVKALKKRAGKFFIFDYPAHSTTTLIIKDDIRKLQSKGEQIDLVVVDYGDLLNPRYRTDNVWKDEGSIFIDLRDIAKEYNIPVLTASHIQRSSSTKSLATGRDTAGSYDKVKHADMIITLNQDEAEAQQGYVRLHIGENRNGARKTLKIKTDYATGKFYKELLEEIL